VTSDNVSPLHLMDIKRIAFETRPVKSARPAATRTVETPMPVAAPQPKQPAVAVAGGKINREEIAAIVDKFLAGRAPAAAEAPRPAASQSAEAEAGSMYSGPPPSGRTSAPAPAPAAADKPASNGRQAVDFVSEDDVRRALQKGEKIYINAKTIITPAARDIGEPKEVFAKA
jgi:hypothetical protein